MAEFDGRRLYQRKGKDFCPTHGRFMRPMSKPEWLRHVEAKHGTKIDWDGQGMRE